MTPIPRHAALLLSPCEAGGGDQTQSGEGGLQAPYVTEELPPPHFVWSPSPAAQGRRRCHHLRRSPVAATLLSAALLSGCLVGPNYHRPAAPTESRFKEADGWRPVHPTDAISKGAWWSMFDDPVLDGLERRVAVNNQNVAQYVAAYREAHQVVAEVRSQFFPTVSGSGGVTYSKSGSGGGSSVATTTAAGTTGVITSSAGAYTAYTATLDASWVPDLWGRVRRTVESDKALAQASAADLANVTLSAQATLAENYFELRVADQETQLYRDTVADYQRFLQLTVNQYNVGYAARSAVLSAQTQLLGAQAQLVDIGTTRGQLEHAIAMLVGVTPADLSIAPAVLKREVPVAPTGVASALLERRPDISAAERRADSGNALIGVAKSAFYPTLTLSGDYGYGASNLGSLFNASSSLWSVGAELADTLFDAGLRRAQVRAARAVYDADVAVYRQTVLTAFQGVEDQLVALRVYQQEEEVRLQDEAAARQAEQLDLNEYKAGTVDYTTVITAQTAALSASQGVLTTLQNRLVASVALVEDLGGGWDVSELPKS